MRSVRTSRRGRAAAVAQETTRPYLVVAVGDEEYAVPLAGLQEIVALGPLASVPDAPAAVMGTLRLRERRLAVVDVAFVFAARATTPGAETCALIATVATGCGPETIGLAVDAARSMVAVGPADLTPAPRATTLMDFEFVASMARVDDRLVPVLDLERLLASPEVRAAAQATDATP